VHSFKRLKSREGDKKGRVPFQRKKKGNEGKRKEKEERTWCERGEGDDAGREGQTLGAQGGPRVVMS